MCFESYPLGRICKTFCNIKIANVPQDSSGIKLTEKAVLDTFSYYE